MGSRIGEFQNKLNALGNPEWFTESQMDEFNEYMSELHCRIVYGECPKCDSVLGPKKRCFTCNPEEPRDVSVCEYRDAVRFAQRVALLEPFGGKCQECGKEDDPFLLHLHHKEGTVKGGRHRIKPVEREVEKYPERFVLLCRTCHGKAHRAPHVPHEAQAPREA